mgnify:CR=1 FL=1
MNFLQIAEVTGRAELSLVQGPALVLAAQAGDEVFGTHRFLYLRGIPLSRSDKAKSALLLKQIAG